MAYIDRTLAQRCLDDLSSDNLIGNENDTFISLAEAKDKIEELPTADVVPKSVYDATQHILKGAFERIEQLDKLCGELQTAKADVAREIFEEIEKVLKEHHKFYGLFGEFRTRAIIEELDELKKKYTEGE